MRERLLVTGASGLLGSTVARIAHEQGWDVTAVGNRHPVMVADVESVAADLQEDGVADALVRHVAPTSVVHCAAITDVDACESLPDGGLRLHRDATRALARTAGAHARFVYISTDSVFDGTRSWYSEADLTGPINAYSRSKLEGEHAVREELGTRGLVIRTSPYGAAGRGTNIAEWLMGKLGRREPIGGFADVYFTPILADDLASIVLKLIEVGASGTYHAAGSERISKYDFAVRFARALNADASLVTARPIADAQLRAPRPKDTSLATAKIAREIGPMPSLDEGLTRFASGRR